MAIGSGMPPLLSTLRSAQSGTKGMTAFMAVVFLDQSTTAWIFQGATIDLSPMQAGDTIVIRVRTQLANGLGFANEDLVTYTNAQPANHLQIRINPIPNTYGVEISMQQSAGVLRNIQCDFYGAKRLGLG